MAFETVFYGTPPSTCPDPGVSLRCWIRMVGTEPGRHDALSGSFRRDSATPRRGRGLEGLWVRYATEVRGDL